VHLIVRSHGNANPPVLIPLTGPHLPCRSGASRLDVGPALLLQFHHAHYA
jgi:hypothetical protein